MNKLEIFGKVWGLDFIFDFLNKHQLLPGEHYEKMLVNISYLRNEMMRISGSYLWQMMFVFKWPRPGKYAINPSEQQLFDETYGVDETEALEKVRKYLSDYHTPGRIKDELKLNNPGKVNKLPVRAENTSYKEKPLTGRNEPCPCGSGKKYKKCCLNK